MEILSCNDYLIQGIPLIARYKVLFPPRNCLYFSLATTSFQSYTN